MSGSDSTTTISTGGGAGSPCPDDLETVLGSPDPDAVARLIRGDVLDVLRIDDPVRGVGAFTADGVLVGAVTREILALRRCLSEGILYIGEVRSVNGGAVTIVIRQR